MISDLGRSMGYCQPGGQGAGGIIGCDARRVMRRILPLASLLLAACLIQPTQDHGGFTVSPARFFDQAQRLLLVPVRVPDDVRVSQETTASIDSAIAAHAATLGVEVIGAQEYAAIWQRLTEEAGGFFDPYTGRRDEPEFEAAVAQLYRELEERFQPNALLYPELIVVEAYVEGDLAEWSGTDQRLDEPVEPGSAVLALTLAMAIDDIEGNELYYREAGLVILDASEGWIPHDLLREEPQRIGRAVETALEPLVNEARDRTSADRPAPGSQTK